MKLTVYICISCHMHVCRLKKTTLKKAQFRWGFLSSLEAVLFFQDLNNSHRVHSVQGGPALSLGLALLYKYTMGLGPEGTAKVSGLGQDRRPASARSQGDGAHSQSSLTMPPGPPSSPLPKRPPPAFPSSERTVSFFSHCFLPEMVSRLRPTPFSFCALLGTKGPQGGWRAQGSSSAPPSHPTPPTPPPASLDG